MSKNNPNESGQSTIEFIFTFAFGVSIIFLVFNSALNYATGYLVHYATFMASRTYLVADSYVGTIGQTEASMNGSELKARQTFDKYMLQIFDVPSSGFKVNPPGNDSATYLTVGAATVFDLKIDALGKVTGQSVLELTSESFLGREPTRAQCANRVCFGMTNSVSCTSAMDITLYDNGC